MHCRFPAACGGAPRVGQILVAAVSDCLAKMLYAAGRHDDVNATWQGWWYLGGPGWFYGGHHRDGLPVPQGLYDTHGGGLGATPNRDQVQKRNQFNSDRARRRLGLPKRLAYGAAEIDVCDGARAGRPQAKACWSGMQAPSARLVLT